MGFLKIRRRVAGVLPDHGGVLTATVSEGLRRRGIATKVTREGDRSARLGVLLVNSPRVDPAQLALSIPVVAVIEGDISEWYSAGRLDWFDLVIVDRSGTDRTLSHRTTAPIVELDRQSGNIVGIGEVADLIGCPPIRRSSVQLGIFPDYRNTNPFQTMLLSQCREAGIWARPMPPPHQLETAPGSPDGTLIYHISWTAPILGSAPDSSAAAARLDQTLERLEALRTAGGKLVWSIHNVMPHELPYPELELTLRRYLAGHADLIHVLCKQTFSAVEPYFTLPEDRVVVIPHSSYEGVYSPRLSKEEARRILGIGAREVVAFIGAIRPYKGLDLLLKAVDRLRYSRDLLLVIAGENRPHMYGDPPVEPGEDPGTLCIFERLSIERVEAVVRAADAVVLPYVTILNSGAAILALTLGRPVVVPAVGCLPWTLPQPPAVLYDPNEGLGLEEAIVQALDSKDSAEPLARTWAMQHSPEAMAAEFVDALTQVFD